LSRENEMVDLSEAILLAEASSRGSKIMRFNFMCLCLTQLDV